MPTILITGANRGIGLALSQSYLADGWQVLATTRNSNATVASGAQQLLLDVSCEDSIAALGKQLSGRPIDIIWNNAGVYLDKGQSLEQLEMHTWLQSFAINSIAPIKIAQALHTNLQTSQRKVLAFTSSKMGSLSENGQQAFAYRSSKSALNMAVRCLAHDYSAQKISCLLLHPGHVRTAMGGAEGAIDTATSVAGMRAIVDSANSDNYPHMSSRYYDYDGKIIPW
ncbi:MAG: hypothetical protein OFPI_34860 [Osedax symbiont Rs2]|nr:MAG: hypothetical protein OFPI_34860 [Osedax symbiont Rs2]